MEINNKYLKKIYTKDKGYGFIAKINIPKNTIILCEKPKFYLQKESTYFNIFVLLYSLLSSNDNESIKNFTNMLPKNLDNFQTVISIVSEEFTNLNKNSEIYKFLVTNFTSTEICLYVCKFMCNAFTFGNTGCALLFNGNILNHSCLPNVVFGLKDNFIQFITTQVVKKNDEIYDSYIDITLSKKDRQSHLLKQYGFLCKCNRCDEKDNSIIKTMDNTATNLELLKYKMFGYCKSIKM